METAVRDILLQQGTKTQKIRQLLMLGFTRRQTADLAANGHYGFVFNVHKRMAAAGEFNRHLNDGSPPFNYALNRTFGVEFEAYNVEKSVLRNALNAAGIACEVESYNHTTRTHWKIVTDASLSGNNTFELVSPILSGSEGMRQLEVVCRVPNECGAKVNKSCGTHVHLGAKDFSIEQWRRIYINYSRLENVIDAFMPKSRRASENRYTRSLLNISDLERRINACAAVTDIEEIFHSRYFKVNPESYRRHRTCEFRQHSGTIEFAKIKNWITFVNNLVEYSKENLVGCNTALDSLPFGDVELKHYYQQRTLRMAA